MASRLSSRRAWATNRVDWWPIVHRWTGPHIPHRRMCFYSVFSGTRGHVFCYVQVPCRPIYRRIIFHEPWKAQDDPKGHWQHIELRGESETAHLDFHRDEICTYSGWSCWVCRADSYWVAMFLKLGLQAQPRGSLQANHGLKTTTRVKHRRNFFASYFYRIIQ